MKPKYTIHKLKTHHRFFVDVKSGIKTVEIRKNDRPEKYKVGDYLLLQDYIPETETYTGEDCLRRITHIIDEQPYVPKDYVAMSIKPC